ncbi:MAG: hypothetical protein RI910_617 [Verrucomicrobiota bacterium]|jgi:hypothetical protein
MARPPTKVCLQKTLKEGLRRCVYRRWEAEVKGKVLITKTTELERLYRGNTPYPTKAAQVRRRAFAKASQAHASMAEIFQRRLRAGYQPK